MEDHHYMGKLKTLVKRQSNKTILCTNLQAVFLTLDSVQLVN